MKENKHREPTLFIVGNPERKDEIRHILEDEWGGFNDFNYTYNEQNRAYFIDCYGFINWNLVSCSKHINAVERGWRKEYKLPEQPKFKPFDKVVVKIKCHSKWYADIFSHESEKYFHFLGDFTGKKEETIILPFNEHTAKLIGTNDEWKGGE